MLINGSSDTRLRIQSRVSLIEPLPLAYLAADRVRAGRRGRSAYYDWFGGYYQDPKNHSVVGAVDVDRLHCNVPGAGTCRRTQSSAMRSTRNGALIGRDLAAQRAAGRSATGCRSSRASGTRKDGAREWDFEIVGIYDVRATARSRRTSFLDQLRRTSTRRARSGNGTVMMVFRARSRIPRGRRRSRGRRSAMFANSTYETQDAERARLAPRPHRADRRHQLLRERDRRRGDVHAAVPDRQHDDAVRARAHSRARGAEDATASATRRHRARVRASRCCSASLRPASASAIAAALSPMIFRQLGAGGMSFPAQRDRRPASRWPLPSRS